MIFIKKIYVPSIEKKFIINIKKTKLKKKSYLIK